MANHIQTRVEGRKGLVGESIVRLKRQNLSKYEVEDVEGLTDGQVRKLTEIRRWMPSKEKLFRRCWGKKASPRQMIKAFCVDCLGGVVRDIEGCGASWCPMWHGRPYKG
jgi:hypothetical protein